MSVCIRIYIDDFMVYQYFMDHTSIGNIPWLEGKRQTVKETGYSSLYVMEHQDDYLLLQKDENCKLYGGAFPIQCLDTNVIICVSGMAESFDDHRLIIEALNHCFMNNKYTI